MSFRLTGLVAAPFTPLHADGTLNPDVIGQQARSLRATGVRGAFVCGTTGECHSLTVAERKAVAERWVREAGKDMPIVVHVGHHSLPNAQELAAHAATIGASAIAALAPSYFKPQTVADLVDYCAELTAAAPQLPFYYYHIPSLTGVALPMADFLRQAAPRIPSLVGIKFTFTDLMMMQECMAVEDGRFDIVHGTDEILLAGLALGAQGAVGSTYNYAAATYHEVMRCFAAGDLVGARRAQQQAVAMVRVLIDFGGLRAGKAIMKLSGIDCGPVRRPLRSLDAAETAELTRRLTLPNAVR